VEILIGEQYKITSDVYNVIVNQRYEKQKNGEPTGEHDFKPVAYCRNLESACLNILARNVRISDAENLAEIVGIIQGTKKEIFEAVKGLDKEEVAK
jgi:hypothetical protein